MKTATVRDLRNRFPRVAAWIAEGEPVEITRAGKLFARLVPPAKTPKLVKPDIMARLKETWGDRIFSNREVAEMRAAELEGEERMIAFPDTSFLFAFYRRQDNSPAAAALFQGHAGSLARFRPAALRISPERPLLSLASCTGQNQRLSAGRLRPCAGRPANRLGHRRGGGGDCRLAGRSPAGRNPFQTPHHIRRTPGV